MTAQCGHAFGPTPSALGSQAASGGSETVMVRSRRADAPPPPQFEARRHRLEDGTHVRIKKTCEMAKVMMVQPIDGEMMYTLYAYFETFRTEEFEDPVEQQQMTNDTSTSQSRPYDAPNDRPTCQPQPHDGAANIEGAMRGKHNLRKQQDAMNEGRSPIAAIGRGTCPAKPDSETIEIAHTRVPAYVPVVVAENLEDNESESLTREERRKQCSGWGKERRETDLQEQVNDFQASLGKAIGTCIEEREIAKSYAIRGHAMLGQLDVYKKMYDQEAWAVASFTQQIA